MQHLKFKILGFLLLHVLTVSCQKLEDTDLILVNNLSKLVREVSGITKLPGHNYVYAINDSGNDNSIFTLDLNGDIIKEIDLHKTKNIDWEDLAYDHDGHVYIGDFGNNRNNRKNLVIYKVSGLPTVKTKISEIRFRLEDQEKFPPKKKRRNYDIEAFIYLKGHLYLFTKNRSSDFDGTTKLYKIPAKPGDYVAKLISTFETCDDHKDCFVTAAAINDTGSKIVLLTYNKLFLIEDFNEDNLFEGKIEKIKLKHYSQKEGICFVNDSTLLIVDEGGKKSGGNLYRYILK
ncbi:SdiA-regulated domain-containing protein [Aquimarina sp. U1-2]|uniref:SdiA-regulated domain-containing protein n=1 Tax=Aquimarina sp. U1-2 TaxID=2823141 RepID=UPI001AECDA5C|nr:SdiA-regulated domain-containing protein [Aquimarina sp. U1-2]MBP2833950.1 SdiA-regulated domain-containing protein [Aquimarina sp. U1-2]